MKTFTKYNLKLVLTIDSESFRAKYATEGWRGAARPGPQPEPGGPGGAAGGGGGDRDRAAAAGDARQGAAGGHRRGGAQDRLQGVRQGGTGDVRRGTHNYVETWPTETLRPCDLEF